MVFLKIALMCIINKKRKKFKLINYDCLPILMLLYIMLCIMLAYLMLFAALSNAVCLYNFVFFFLMLFVIMLCLCLLTHSLFISCINLHHAHRSVVVYNAVYSACLLIAVCCFM